MEANRELISLRTFAEKVIEQCPDPIDEMVTEDDVFALSDKNVVLFGGRPITSVGTFQALTLAKMDVSRLPTRDAERVQLFAKTRNPAADGLRDALVRRLHEINAAFTAGVDLENLRLRVVGDPEYVGGIVTKAYTPFTHRQLVETMLSMPEFADTVVNRYVIDDEFIDATMIIGGQEWKVDGGLKAGVRVRNGQFGNKALAVISMLFRLLCTNGMMDVLDQSKLWRRHVGPVEQLREGAIQVFQHADSMIEGVNSAITTDVNVVEALGLLYVRRLMTRGALQKAVARLDEQFMGVGVTRPRDSLWGLVQVVSAASRDYAFGQMGSMTTLAGRLLREGVPRVVAAHEATEEWPTDLLAAA